MATSGSYSFTPSLGDIVLYAYNIIGVRTTSILQEHMTTARMATNMMLSTWANMGVNLWKVDLVKVTIVQGQATYPIDPSTITILDAYMTTDNGISPPIDRMILPVSRSEYSSYSNKENQGSPTTYWFDRLNANSDMGSPGSSQTVVVTGPQVTLWPVPDGSAQYFQYYRAVQIQTSNFSNAQNADIPYLFLEAFADGLAYRLAKIWKPEMAVALKAVADDTYKTASIKNVEEANTYISPQLSSYYRP